MLIKCWLCGEPYNRDEVREFKCEEDSRVIHICSECDRKVSAGYFQSQSKLY